MPNKYYTRAAKREANLVRQIRDAGGYAFRSAGSKGELDIHGWFPDGINFGIQEKKAEKDFNLKERQKLHRMQVDSINNITIFCCAGGKIWWIMKPRVKWAFREWIDVYRR